jgi:hypothetical protein
MTEPKAVPIDSLNSILAYLDTERRCYEEANDDKQFDYVFWHVAKVRDWLSSFDIKPGVTIVIRDAEGKEISRHPNNQSS